VHWGDQNLKFPIVFMDAGKNKKKIRENPEFLRKIGF